MVNGWLVNKLTGKHSGAEQNDEFFSFNRVTPGKSAGKTDMQVWYKIRQEY
jgi:hypothetical protein